MEEIRYNPYNKYPARKLRKEGTKGEAILWKKVLSRKQMLNQQFNRQYPIGNYIVDFICRKLKLIIEIDGSSHLIKGEIDRKRQNDLESYGFTVSRFHEVEVIYQLDDVYRQIYHVVSALAEQSG